MAEHGWRLPFSFDPLIAEARRRARRRWVLIAAVLVLALVGGGGAAGGILAYSHHGSNRVDTGNPVTVLVARKLLPMGVTTGNEIRQSRLYTLRQIPSSDVENGAIVDPSALPDKAVQVEISPGEQLTASEFSQPRYDTAPSLPVPTVRVLVATKLIPKGTRGDSLRTTAGYYKAVSIPQAQLENGAILKPDLLSGKVTLKRVPPGQQLTIADFGPND